MRFINNQDVVLLSELKTAINEHSSVFISCTYISIPAIFELLGSFNKVQEVRILLDNTLETDTRFVYDELEFQKYFDLQSKYKAKMCLDLASSKFQIRMGNTGGQKFILVNNSEESKCYSIVPYDFNCITLGVLPSALPMIMTEVDDISNPFLPLFNQFWASSPKDLKSLYLNQIRQAFEFHSPEFLYKYTIHNLFKNTTFNEINEERINKIGFKQTEIWKLLFNFQKDAVLGAIDKIETFGGCIIADSVGLGKTFEALAVIKYYELRNDRVLVLAPKKLRDNWLVYTQNDIQNILSKDRLNYDVLNHTDLSRIGGTSGDINLETLNWGNYDLVVIDESHNFRNNNPSDAESKSRYQRLMDDIIKTGVRTKVLMLSATPVNTKMTDIKNQIAFITEQNDLALTEHGIPSISQTLVKAQKTFNKWLKSASDEGSRDLLVEGLDGAYFKLLDLLTIARSRKHIEKYYDVADIGKFPERNAPINIYAPFDINGSLKAMDKVNDEINALNLGFYSPLSYVRDDKKFSYELRYDVTTKRGGIFRQIERESSLIHLMRVNLLKRLESSVHAFRLTLNNLLSQINDQLVKIDNTNKLDVFDSALDINAIETDDATLEDLLIGGKIKVLLQDMDLIKCKEALLDDRNRLENLLAQTSVIDVDRDAKLQELKNLILNKVENNLNEGNKKVIVFSAFADTVKYLYDHLHTWASDNLGIKTAMVTGGDNNKTNLKGCNANLSAILVNFSPRSKKRDMFGQQLTEEIDLLICTDCISEGQNLQDCDYLVNYDIHWNPVRIVQRFGRIDRIGSTNTNIQLVNFFPNLELDTYIDLIGRVKGRMQILDVSATGDDNIIDENKGGINDLDYRKRQLLKLQEKVLDLEDIEGGISITDLTFNDFKIDAERLTLVEKEQFDRSPKAIYTVVDKNLDDIPSGVIFCLKQLEADANPSEIKSATYPYSLCFVTANEEIFVPATNPKKALDYYKKLCLGHKEPLKPLIELFNKTTNGGQNMNSYTNLLQIALNHTKGIEEEFGLNSLLTPGGTKFGKTIKSNSEELISYLIIM